MNAEISFEYEAASSSMQCNFCSQQPLNERLLLQNCIRRCMMLDDRPAKEIDKIVDSSYNPALIMCDDMLVYHQSNEYLKRIYSEEEYTHKIKLLSEYYKFHNEVPRIFMQSIAQTLDDYVDEHRQINFAKITQKLKKTEPEIKGKNQPIVRMFGDIELSYEDFQQRGNKKQRKSGLKNKKHTGKCIKSKFHTQSTDVWSINPISKVMKSNQNSSNKKTTQPSQPHIINERSSKGLSRQKSKGTLQTVPKKSAKKMLTIHKGFVNDNKEPKHVHFKDQKPEPNRNLKNSIDVNQNIRAISRDKCNSNSIIKCIKGSAVPTKMIDMKKLSDSKNQQSNMNLQNLNRVESKDKIQPKHKLSINGEQNLKPYQKDIELYDLSSHQYSQESSSSRIRRPALKSMENMFSGVGNVRKYQNYCQ